MWYCYNDMAAFDGMHGAVAKTVDHSSAVVLELNGPDEGARHKSLAVLFLYLPGQCARHRGIAAGQEICGREDVLQGGEPSQGGERIYAAVYSGFEDAVHQSEKGRIVSLQRVDQRLCIHLHQLLRVDQPF